MFVCVSNVLLCLWLAIHVYMYLCLCVCLCVSMCLCVSLGHCGWCICLCHYASENTFVCVNFCCIKNPDELFFCMLAIILLIFFWYFLFESISVTFPFMFSCVVEKQLFYCSLFLKYLEFWEIAGAGAPSAISRA